MKNRFEKGEIAILSLIFAQLQNYHITLSHRPTKMATLQYTAYLWPNTAYLCQNYKHRLSLAKHRLSLPKFQ